MRSTHRLVLIISILILSPWAKASAGFLSFAYGRGGTALTDVTGGQDYNTQAGSGLTMSGGAIIPISPTTPHRFEAQFGIGYMFQDDAHNEANRVSWSRVPIEALYFYRNTSQQFRLGWGVTYHVAGHISAKGTNSSAEASVDNALGTVVAAEKLWISDVDARGSFSLGVRYVMINYNSSKFSRAADGNTWFLTFSSFTL